MKSLLNIKYLAHGAGLLIVSLFPTFAFAATVVGGFSGSGGFLGISWGGGGGFGCTSTICGIADTVLYIINSILVPTLFALAFIVFLYGIASAYIFSNGDPDKVAAGHKFVFWGIVAFAIMISIWGLVNIVANTFGLNGYYAPPLPTTYP